MSLVILITMCLFWSNLFGTLLVSWTCVSFSSPYEGSFWSLFLQVGSRCLPHSLLLLVYLCYTAYCLKYFLSSPHFFLIHFFLFTALPECCFFFPTLSSKSLIQSSASSNLLFIPSSVVMQILHSLLQTGPFSWCIFIFLFTCCCVSS